MPWQEKVTAALGSGPYPTRPLHKLTLKHFAFLHPDLCCEAPNSTIAEAHMQLPSCLHTWPCSDITCRKALCSFCRNSSWTLLCAACDLLSSASRPHWYSTELKMFTLARKKRQGWNLFLAILANWENKLRMEDRDGPFCSPALTPWL